MEFQRFFRLPTEIKLYYQHEMNWGTWNPFFAIFRNFSFPSLAAPFELCERIILIFTVENEIVAEILIDGIREARRCSVLVNISKKDQDEILSEVWPFLFVLRASCWSYNFLAVYKDRLIHQTVETIRKNCLSPVEIESLKRISLARYGKTREIVFYCNRYLLKQAPMLWNERIYQQ